MGPQVAPGTLLPRQIGNCYTASLWAGLASLVDSQRELLEGRTVLMFSFGSGIAASIFLLTGRRPASLEFLLQRIASQVRCRLQQVYALNLAVPSELADISDETDVLPVQTRQIPVVAMQSALRERLAQRIQRPPAAFEQAAAVAEQRYCEPDFSPDSAVEDVCPGSYYLVQCRGHRRTYSRRQP